MTTLITAAKETNATCDLNITECTHEQCYIAHVTCEFI